MFYCDNWQVQREKRAIRTEEILFEVYAWLKNRMCWPYASNSFQTNRGLTIHSAGIKALLLCHYFSFVLFFITSGEQELAESRWERLNDQEHKWLLTAPSSSSAGHFSDMNKMPQISQTNVLNDKWSQTWQHIHFTSIQWVFLDKQLTSINETTHYALRSRE